MELPSHGAFDAESPIRYPLDRLADKWTALIVGVLAKGPYRFGKLQHAIGGISHKMLAQTLRSLERDGLVDRRPKATVPTTVEYSLTPLGHALCEPVEVLHRWAEEHMKAVRDAQARYDQDQNAADNRQPAQHLRPTSVNGRTRFAKSVPLGSRLTRRTHPQP